MMELDPNKTVYLMFSTCLVFFMVIGLAFFYSGLVRRKNVLNTLMMSFSSIAVVALTWFICGYSLAYAPGNLFIGGLDYIFLNGIGLNLDEGLPKLLDFMFQGTFAIITVALISGAVVERMNFKAFLIFSAIWSVVVYAPMTKWVWGGGIFEHLPNSSAALDFAGGTVVHINAAITAIILASLIGKRRDTGNIAILPHQVPFTLLGAGILWFGWFGFNGGSAYEPNTQAALAMVNSLLCPAATIVTWFVLDLFHVKRITAVGLATAIIVGLVAITPAAGYVSPMSAIIMGILTTFPCFYMIMWRTNSSFDDSLDVFGAHGLGGIIGSILTGAFVSTKWGASIDASLNQVFIQALAVLIAVVYSALMTFIIAKVLGKFINLRSKAANERIGLDLSEHGEEAYSEGEGALLIPVKDSSVARNLVNKYEEQQEKLKV
jgi:Amt family ammonium transporter